MAPRTAQTDENTEVTESNGQTAGPVRRTESAAGIPKRAGSGKNQYPEWQGEIDYLLANLGVATSYESDKVGGLATGLRRVYGVKASIRDQVTEANKHQYPGKPVGFGVLWLTFPVLKDADGNITGIDQDAVDKVKAKYAGQ